MALHFNGMFKVDGETKRLGDGENHQSLFCLESYMRRRATEMPDTRSGIAPSTIRLCASVQRQFSKGYLANLP